MCYLGKGYPSLCEAKKTTIQKSLKGTIILLLLEKRHFMEEINSLGEGLILSPEELLQGVSSLERERNRKDRVGCV